MKKEPKQIVYENMLSKLTKMREEALKVDHWENCPFRRPGRWHACSCNLANHPNCPGWDGTIPDNCPLRKGAILVELEEADEDRTNG